MFLYLMDGCYDWWKEIMQKKALFWWLRLSWKKGRRAKQLHYSWTREFRLLDCRRMHKKLNSYFSIWGRRVSVWNLRVATALSCTLCSTWSSPQIQTMQLNLLTMSAFPALLGLGCFGSNFLTMIFCDPGETIFLSSGKMYPFRI